jgi:CubicO group peptidase (beta-lactamase class C family)
VTSPPPTGAGSPGFSVLVRRPGESPQEVHHGLASLEHSVPIGPGTAFNIGSVAKQITAHLALLAAKDGILDLAQPVATLLPQLLVPGVTFADLITHHSGLRDAESLLSLAGLRDLDHYTSHDLLALVYRQRQRAVPQGQFLYSNTNYLLLTAVLEAVHQAPLDQIAASQVFVPLGMDRTRFKTDPRHFIPGAANAYEPTGNGWRHSASSSTLPGPGSMWTTTHDLSRWLTHLHRLWRTDRHDLPGQQLLRYSESDHPPYLYGPGLYAAFAPPAQVLHYGHEQGFSAAVHLDAANRQIICLSNASTVRAEKLAATTATRSAKELTLHLETVKALPQRPASTPVPTTGPESDSHDTLGSYTCPEAPGILRLTRSANGLCLWRRGTPLKLAQLRADTYVGPGIQVQLPSERPAQPPSGFALSLSRAPNLIYQRI